MDLWDIRPCGCFSLRCAEVAWNLRELGLWHGEARTVSGATWNELLDQWHKSERRQVLRELLKERDGVDPDTVIIPPPKAKQMGLTSTVVFSAGNLCPEGSVIKATSIDPTVIDADGVFQSRARESLYE